MSRATAEDQINFLVCCVKHAHHGKPDFVAVAKELGIVTKGAAAKRFERLVKTCETHSQGPGIAEKLPQPTNTRKKSKDATTKAASYKKRKFEVEADRFQYSQASASMSQYPKTESEHNPMNTKTEPYGYRDLMDHHTIMSPLPQFPFHPYHGTIQHIPGPPMLVPPYPAVPAPRHLQTQMPNYAHMQTQYGQPVAQHSPNYLLTQRLPSVPPIPHRLSGVSSAGPIPAFVDPFVKQENHGDNFSLNNLGPFAPHPLDSAQTAPINSKEVVPNVIEPTASSAPTATSVPNIKVELEAVSKDTLADRNCIFIAD